MRAAWSSKNEASRQIIAFRKSVLLSERRGKASARVLIARVFGTVKAAASRNR